MSSLTSTLALIGPIGTTEAIVILVIGLLLFGRRLPEVGRSIGKGIVEFRKGLSGIEQEVQQSANRPPEPPAPAKLPEGDRVAQAKVSPYSTQANSGAQTE